jgi:hypothetical protein
MKDDDTQGKSAARRTQAEKSARRIDREINTRPGALSLEAGTLAFVERPVQQPQGAARGKAPAGKSELSEQIGVRLRGIYDDVLAQPVPERFLDLLRQLETTSYAPAKKGES